jgi:hypothetical protein
MAQVLKGRLIHDGVMSGKLSSDATVGDVNSFMESVGIAVMRGHATAVQRDFTGKLGDRWGVLDKYQAAVFHHKVFSNQGLNPHVYGGTPIGFGGYVPFISAQAWMTNKIANLPSFGIWFPTKSGATRVFDSWCGHMCFGQGYISNEDTHHDPVGR